MYRNSSKVIGTTLPVLAMMLYKEYKETQVEQKNHEFRLPGTVQMLFVTVLTSALYFDYDE